MRSQLTHGEGSGQPVANLLSSIYSAGQTRPDPLLILVFGPLFSTLGEFEENATA
jgi:hypothetical protein